MNPPALFKMSESSLRLSLLGSTPKEREKSFVARSMLEVYGGVLGGVELMYGRDMPNNGIKFWQ